MSAGTVLYDGDCAFCTSAASLLARWAPRVEVVPWQTADLDALGETAARCTRELRWVGSHRDHAGGATAVARALATGGPQWRLVGLLILLTRPVSTLAYRLVAANRQHLPGGTPACAVPKDPAA